MSGAKRPSRAGRAGARLLVGLALAAAAMGAARAQDLPTVVAPLRVEPDVNGVNLATGRIAIDPPVLAVPAAPNLRFDRVQNAAPYMTGRTVGEHLVNYAVHTGAGGSEAFRCEWGACTSVTGTGSTLVGENTQTGIAWTFAQAGSGIVWNFTLRSHDTTNLIGGTSLHYAASVVHPNGERLDYAHDSPIGPLNQRVFRTTRITSNLGYHIAIDYQVGVLGTNEWNAPSQAALYRAGATPVLLRRFTYTGPGLRDSTGTVTDWGASAANVGGRVYSCSGCTNSLGTDLEVWEGWLRLPGETSPIPPTVQVTQTAQTAAWGQGVKTDVPLIGSLTRDGVTWTYTYTGLTWEQSRPWYDSVRVTGPDGYRREYAMTRMDGQIVASVTENVTATDTRRTEFRHDTASRPDRITYPELNRVDLVYDGYGNIVSRTTTPKPNMGSAVTETASYPTGCDPSAPLPCYRPTWHRDALGRQTDFLFNAQGQLTRRTDPADREGRERTTAIGYAESAAGISRREVVTVCGTGADCGTAAAIRTEYDYWGDTLLPAVERRVSGTTILTTTYSYYDSGLVRSVNGPLAGTDDAVYHCYDSYGRNILEIGPLGANGVRLAQRHAYRNSDDRLVRTETGTVATASCTAPFTELRQVEYGYDERRNRNRETVSSVNSAGTTVYHTVLQRRFDDRGRVECEARRMNPAQLATGNLPASACDREASGGFGPDRIRRFTYDSAGQLLREYRAWGVTTTNGFPATLQQVHAAYSYTPNGQRSSVTDANGNRAELRYDGFDRLSRWVFPSRTTDGQVNEADYEEYGYDAAGNRTSLRKRDGSVLTYLYDDLDRMIRKRVPERTGLDPAHTRDVFYDYNVRDQMTDARFDGWSGPGIGLGYDGFGRMISSSNNMDGVTRRFDYAWDSAGNRTGVSYPNAMDLAYAWDAAGRLTGITDSDAAEPLFAFSYDSLGRLDLRTDPGAGGIDHGYDRADRLTSMAHTFAGGAGNVTFGFTYNPASQVVTRTRSNDAYASTTAYDISRGYEVDGLNQYRRTVTPSGGTATAFSYDANGNLVTSGTLSYVYDVENRLVGVSGARTGSLRYDPLGRLYEAAGPSGTRRFYWDGDALAAEYHTTGALAAEFVHGGSAGDDPLLWRGGGENRRLHADHQGSIVAITNDAGTAQWINGYDPWGIPNAGNAGRFQYTGQIWLGDFGMYHYKGRMYSPTLGRFLQVDPVGYEGGINLYAYVGNDPLNNTDPDGQYPAVIGGAVVACAMNPLCRRVVAAGVAGAAALLLRRPAIPITAGPRSSSIGSSTNRQESRSASSAAPVAQPSGRQNYSVRVQAQGHGLREERSKPITQERPVTVGQVDAAITEVNAQLTGREQRILAPAVEEARAYAQRIAEGGGISGLERRSFGNSQYSESDYRIDIEVLRGHNIVPD